MKTKYLLLGAIFAVFSLGVRAQVVEMFSQGFESGEAVNYSGTPATGVRYSTSIHSIGGNRALKLVQSNSQDVEIILDTIDFTQNTTLRYIALRFDHICRVPKNSSTDYAMGTLYYKRAGQTEWTTMTGDEYNISSGVYSTDFNSSGSFKDESYSDWWNQNVSTVSNEQWRTERFDLDNVLTAGVPANQRKLVIKFVLARRNLTSTLDTANIAWWIDNITISASAERMVTPKITMFEYPTVEAYPNSRGAHIDLSATTSVSAGINPDSVLLFYKGGSDPTVHQLSLAPVPGLPTHYECRIPFYGYDTMMSFYCVARDATSNSNKVVYPVGAESDESVWINYRCVRGNTVQPGLATPEFTGTTSSAYYPLPVDADHRCEIVYDSALMRAAGYGPGAITAMRFTVASSVVQQRTESRFQIKMKNVSSDYSVDLDENMFRYYFTTNALQIVYDSSLTIPVMPSNLEMTIQFQDTFFYAGSDIIMQITYDGNADHSSPIDIKTISAPANKQTIFFMNGIAEYGYNPFTADDFEHTTSSDSHRPAFVFTETKLAPLLYDAGISELVTPNYDVPMTDRPDSIVVKLKNYGERTLSNVHISYSIDDTITGSYNWTGSLAGDAETTVLIATNINIPAGFHNLKVWTEDTVVSSGQNYRDHEPYNNIQISDFVVCDGEMSGVRNIGGSNPDFNTIEEFLFSLSRCGINDSLIVRLAPGVYPPFVMPAVPGVSESNYIVFESMQTSSMAVIYTDSTFPQASIVNLANASNIRFRNLIFRRDNGELTDMVTLGPNSANCQFRNCTFTDMLDNPIASLRINAMIYSGNADNMLVDSCTFTGGNIGVSIRGTAPDNYSDAVTVRKSLFYNQYSNAIKVEYMEDISLVDNEMYDVINNSSYVVLLNGCSGTIGVERNKIYTSRGAGAMALSDVTATESNRALVANNMIVCNDDGTANQLTTPLNIIQGGWIDVVYNSVKLTAPTRVNVAAVTFGGGAIDNCRFMNNIVATFDNMNYALSYQPLASTTNTVSHNDYFSNGTVLNRRGSSSYTSLDNWRAAMTADTVSVSVNPNFLNTTLVDLRTYNRNLKGIGVPLASVLTDIYGNVRGDSATCPGAFEFSSLPYDFEVESLVSPLYETCYMPASVELVVRMRNSGISVHDSNSVNPLQLGCRVNTGAIQTVTVNETIPADDTVSVHTGLMLNLPSGTFDDASYTVRVWLSSTDDPNQTNDTSVFTVLSRYHPAAPADIIDSIDYANSDTIVPTAGINTWQVYGNAGAPRRPSTIYWYHDSTDTEPFYVGPSHITGVLYQDADFYIRQRRAMPIVRFTQVEIMHTPASAGLTTPMPYWMSASRKVAVQLTNIGDATAYLEGDSLMTVSPTAALNQVYTFGNVKIEPGQSLVMQYVGNAAVDTSANVRRLTLPTGTTPSINYNSNVAFVYKRNGVVEDAVPLNSVITSSSTQAVTWANLGVPSYVWNGSALSYPNNTSGIYRTGFSGGSGDWEFSSAANPMFLGTTKEEWIWYTDYGCEGDLAHVRVALRQLPAVDVSVDAPILPEGGCDMGYEPVTVKVSNFGGDTVGNVVLNYCAGGDTITETVYGIIPPFSDTTYTFSDQINFAFDRDSLVVVRVWAVADTNDPFQFNDTNMAVVLSKFTPGAPAALPDRTVQYATSDTITHMPTLDVIPMWYDFDLNPVDTGYTHITELLYANGARAMSYLALTNGESQIGYSDTTNANTAYPSPYQPSSKYAKQQFIYSASDLRSAGTTAGKISAISFYLDTIVGSTDSINYLNYTISIGSTLDTIFTNANTGANGWIPTTVVYSRDVLTLHQTDDHAWVTHMFDTPYWWDGTSSVVVEVSYELTSAVSTGVKTRYSTKANTTLHKNQNNPILATTGSLTKGNKRPNIKFTSIYYGCAGPMTMFNVNLVGMPEHDAALFWDANLDTMVYNSHDTIGLPIKVRNQGSEPFDTLTLFYYLDNLALDSTVVVDSFAAGHTYHLTLLDSVLAPGRHTVTAFVATAGDSIASNDTIRGSFSVRFYGGDYTISASDATADYPSFGAAIDTLNQVGVVGPVTFLVSPGVYSEQVVLNNVNGSSEANTIAFVGQGDSVLLTASTSQAANYVMMIDGASNVRIENLMLEARPLANNVNYANALVLLNDNNIHIDGCYFKVKGTIVNANASCIVLQGNVSNLYMTGSVTDSGYYAFKTSGTEGNYSSFHFYDNTFRDFASGGIYIRDISLLDITHNEIRSGNSANNRGLIGLYLAITTDTMIVQKNSIYLVDERTGAKRGIQMENVVGTTITPALVVNNMISTHGTGSTGLTPAKSAGIWLDSTCANVNIYYNSVRVRGSNITPTSTTSQINAANDLSYAFWCGTSPTQISVMNNIFSNFGHGYAYYVSQVNTVSTSDYNAYYTEATKKFAWGSVNNIATLSALQSQSSTDGTSVLEEPYFIANDNLHLTMTNFAGKAQYNPDVIDDIDGTSRLPLGPTIGAHEKYRDNHDMAVVRISKPSFNTVNVETDSVLVVASFNNNGLSNESGVEWYAYIEGFESTTRSPNMPLGTFAPSQMKTDSVMIPTALGIIDTQRVRVVLVVANDQAPEDNEKSELFYLAPAFNLAAVKVTATGSYPIAGCRMQNTEIKINVKNDGSKAFAAGTTFKIGYSTEITTPANLEIPTLPPPTEQYVTLDNPLPTGSDIWFTFDDLANLYPTGTYTNIKVRVRGWVNFQYDISQGNDTTSLSAANSPVKDSYYTPAKPEKHDTTLAYGTWGEVTSAQENNRPIRWFRDSTAAPFYSPNQYAASKKWSNTPQYFHDSTYYLNAVSDKNCPSHFESVTVHVAERKTRDMAVVQMLAPLGGRVYMENDTVRVLISNYGTAAQSNFPITYQLKHNNNVVQTRTETVMANINPDDTYVYTFDTLLAIPYPLDAKNYTLNVWTDLNNDATRRNDTLRTPYAFSSKAQTIYTPNTTVDYPSAENTHFDISRVAFNCIDLDMPALNRAYTNMADFENPEYPVLHVVRGTTDSIFIQVAQLDATEQHFRCRGSVMIDFDRDGEFTLGGSCNEVVVNAEPFYSDSTLSAVITIPSCASLGYMRMRVRVMGYAAEATDGHIIDFLLFVDENAPVADLALTQLVSPRDQIIRTDDPNTILFRMANLGSTPINSVDIHYRFLSDTIDTTASGVIEWTGVLDGGQSTLVALPPQVFPFGTTSLVIWHSMDDDVNKMNDTIYYEYHRFIVTRPIVFDDFDVSDDWYAPKGYNAYSHNYWQRGMPTLPKTRIDTTYSGEYAWVTDLSANTIVTGKRGNVSYLYSPIVNIAQVRPDTIAIRLRRNLTGGSSMHIEYFNYERKWVKLYHDSTNMWYNDMDNGAFTGTSSNSEGYGYYCFSATSMRISNDFNENLQFRIVYKTPMGSSSTAAFGEGCAVDDFYIGRARAKYDAGVVDITQPEAPRYGQTIYPEVVVMNYGYDTLRNIRIGYTHYGTYLAKYSDIVCHIDPGATDTFQCTAPFIVTSDYPDTFQITAFTTLSADTYRNNDTLKKDFALSPLDNDISAEELVAPLNFVVAGDTSVKVTLRMRNFGYNAISTATATFILNGITRVDEEIDFQELLGRPLESLEYFNYTFHRRITAPMGIMNLTAFIKSPNNDYIYNDTVTKRVEGIMSITDLAASGVIVNEDHGQTVIGLIIDNVGARGANNFGVGYWIDNDTSTMVRETYYRAQPLPALSRGYYRFNSTLPERSAGYNLVSAFVHVNGDNDASNDTTDVFAEHYIDIEVLRVLVEENASNDCRVFLELRNNGNLALMNTQPLRLRAVINGSDSNITNINRRIDPSDVVHVEMNRRIPKSPIRQYVGTGYIRKVSGDENQANDQTSIVEVINYFEDAPTVNGDNLVLEQNYPNPFSQQTTIPFTLPNAASVRFFVMNAMGNIVYRDEQFYQSGSHYITIDMEAYAAGVYYYGIEVNGQRQMRKMILR